MGERGKHTAKKNTRPSKILLGNIEIVYGGEEEEKLVKGHT